MIFCTSSAARAKATIDSLLYKKERFYRRERDNHIEICAVADDHTALWAHPLPHSDPTSKVWYLFFSEEDFEPTNRIFPLLREPKEDLNVQE